MRLRISTRKVNTILKYQEMNDAHAPAEEGDKCLALFILRLHLVVISLSLPLSLFLFLFLSFFQFKGCIDMGSIHGKHVLTLPKQVKYIINKSEINNTNEQ